MICERCKCEIESHKKMKPELMIQKICDYYELPVGWIISNSRKKPYAEARHVICDILHNNLDCTLKEIGELLGNRDHTTVLNSIKSIRNWCFDTEFRDYYMKLHKSIFGHDRFFIYTEEYYTKNRPKKNKFYISRLS